MSELFLVVVDTSRIQDYVFKSNRLREAIGASYLISMATREWTREIIQKIAKDKNNLESGRGFNSKYIEIDSSLEVEVIYHGGGNFLGLFRTWELAKQFVESLTLKALRKAPGLQLVVAIQPYSWGNDLNAAVGMAFKTLDEKKGNRPFSSPLLGLGVTQACRSTGLPAVAESPRIEDDESIYPVSAEVKAKLEVVKAANERLEEEFREPLTELKQRVRKPAVFPFDFDRLGRSHEEFSFIAVIHADGNGMGQRFVDNGQKCSDDPRKYILSQREFSQKLEETQKKALAQALIRVAKSVQEDEYGYAIAQRNNDGAQVVRIPLAYNTRNGYYYMPVRPILYGGDDVALVCDGRLGLSLAVAFMEEYQKMTGEANLPDNKGSATASAGVAIVKAHYPFAQAYRLAEQLCGKAKQYRRELDPNHQKNVTCLDWHFALGGLFGDISEIREREYTVKAGHLNVRPVTLSVNMDQEIRSWPVVLAGTLAFQGNDWFERHNKVKDLREALRGGETAIEAFLLKYDARKTGLPAIDPSHPQLKEKGWAGGYCGYFDMVELADWFVSLGGRDE